MNTTTKSFAYFVEYIAFDMELLNNAYDISASVPRSEQSKWQVLSTSFLNAVLHYTRLQVKKQIDTLPHKWQKQFPFLAPYILTGTK